MRRALVSILYVIEWEKPLAIKSILTQCRTLLYIISIDLRPSINSQSNTHTHTQIRLTQSVTPTNCVTLWLMLNFFLFLFIRQFIFCSLFIATTCQYLLSFCERFLLRFTNIDRLMFYFIYLRNEQKSFCCCFSHYCATGCWGSKCYTQSLIFFYIFYINLILIPKKNCTN